MAGRYRYRKYVGEKEFSNRFAAPEEIASTLHHVDLTSGELPLNTGGAPFISDTKEAYVETGDYHTLILGATGSMKTRLFILPTVFTLGLAGENMVIADPKGEIYEKTSGFLKEKGYEVRVLNMREMDKSDCWNPFEEAWLLFHSGKKEAGLKLASDFVNTLVAPFMAKNADLYWPDCARSFLNGAAELMIRGSTDRDQCNVSSLISFLPFARRENNNSESELQEFVAKLPPQNVIHQNMSATVSNAPTTLSCILGFVSTILAPFIESKTLQQISAKSTIDIHAFKDEKRKVAVFMIVPDESTTYHFFVASFIKQLYSTVIDDAYFCPNGALPRRLNFLLDEFANIPRIPDMSTMITAARSRNIRFYLVVQSDTQLRVNYEEEAETIKTNCLNWVYLASKETNLIDQVQELVGSETRDLGSNPLISFFELSTLKKEFGENGGAEAIILISRSKAFKTFLPDISRYKQFVERPMAPFPKTDSTITYFDIRRRALLLSKEEALEIYDEESSDNDPLNVNKKLPVEE